MQKKENIFKDAGKCFQDIKYMQGKMSGTKEKQKKGTKQNDEESHI